MAKFVASVAATPAVASGFKKATAFFNTYIRKPDGSRTKIGERGIPLYDSRKHDAAFIARMQQEDAIEALKGVLEFDLVIVNDTPMDEKSLGF